MISNLIAASVLLVAGPPDHLFEDLKNAPSPEVAEPIAEDIWASWLEGDSAVIEVIMKRAMEAQGAGDLDTALEFYDQAILIAPDYAEAYNRRATVFLSQDKLDQALLDLNETLRLEPRHFGAWMGMGIILTELGAEEEAIRAFEKVLEFHPQSQSARDAIARLRKETLGRGI